LLLFGVVNGPGAPSDLLVDELLDLEAGVDVVDVDAKNEPFTLRARLLYTCGNTNKNDEQFVQHEQPYRSTPYIHVLLLGPQCIKSSTTCSSRWKTIASSVGFNAVICRMTHNFAAPEVNMIGVFRLFTHSQYLLSEHQHSLADLLAQTKLGREFAARHRSAPTFNVLSSPAVQLHDSSKRGEVELTALEYEYVRGLARSAIPDYDSVCNQFQTQRLVGSKRALATSADLVKWALVQPLSASQVALAAGPPLRAVRFFSATINGDRFGSADREAKRAVSRSRNSGIAVSGARLGKPALFGSIVHFLDCQFAGKPLVVARVRLHETMGQEARTRMHRVSFAHQLVGVQFEYVLASDVLHSVAFAEQSKGTKVHWVIDCSRG
jgi:hypothetical protein